MEPHAHIATVKTITLPSGRKVELINFAAESAAQAAPEPAIQTPLYCCPDCGSELMQPLQWSERADGSWEMTLRCPECQRRRKGVFGEAQIECLEDAIDQALAMMIDDLQRLARSNMVEDVERFIAALERDLVVPEDF